MAIYKYQRFLESSDDDAFDGEHPPGGPAPLAGIYRCTECNREVVTAKGEPLPTDDHHRHRGAQGAINWRLVVMADRRGIA